MDPDRQVDLVTIPALSLWQPYASDALEADRG